MIRAVWGLAGLVLLGAAGSVWLLAPGGPDKAEPSGAGEAALQDETGMLGDSPAVCNPSATPPPGKQLWRWMDLTVLLPEEGFNAHPEEIPPELKPPNGGPGLMTGSFDLSGEGRAGSSLLIDAETGAIVHTGSPEHGKATGIALCPFDPATAPWPYNGEPPPASTTVWPSIRPDPGSGMYASFTVGSGGYRGTPPPWVECQRVFEGISVANGRSNAFVGLDSVNGAVCKNLANVLPEDVAAFERFLDRAALCDLQNTDC